MSFSQRIISVIFIDSSNSSIKVNKKKTRETEPIQFNRITATLFTNLLFFSIYITLHTRDQSVKPIKKKPDLKLNYISLTKHVIKSSH
jgi:hypothetical protein